MPGIQKIEGETRIAKSQEIADTEEAVFAIAKEIDASNECLNDLNETLKMAIDKHELYKIKADRAKKLMRRLASEL